MGTAFSRYPLTRVCTQLPLQGCLDDLHSLVDGGGQLLSWVPAFLHGRRGTLAMLRGCFEKERYSGYAQRLLLKGTLAMLRGCISKERHSGHAQSLLFEGEVLLLC